jgi:hypothetical protein
VLLVDLAGRDALPIIQLADTHRIDLADAALLYLADLQGVGAMATDDQRLVMVCSRPGGSARSRWVDNQESHGGDKT